MDKRIRLVETKNNTSVAIINEIPNIRDHIFVDELNKEYVVEAIVRNYSTPEVRVMISPVDIEHNKAYGWKKFLL